MESVLFYTLVVIAGPLVLAGAIAFAMLRNRASRTSRAHSDEGTRKLYKELNEEDRSRTP